MKRLIAFSILAMSFLGLAFAQSQNSDTSTDKSTSSVAKTQSQSNPKSSEYGKQAEQDMGKMDKNQDRKLSQDEAQMDPVLVGRWVDFDINMDGSIDQTEYLLFAAHRTIEEQQSQQSNSQSNSAQSDSSSQGSSQKPSS